jgi:hypothetical protein
MIADKSPDATKVTRMGPPPLPTMRKRFRLDPSETKKVSTMTFTEELQELRRTEVGMSREIYALDKEQRRIGALKKKVLVENTHQVSKLDRLATAAVIQELCDDEIKVTEKLDELRKKRADVQEQIKQVQTEINAPDAHMHELLTFLRECGRTTGFPKVLLDQYAAKVAAYVEILEHWVTRQDVLVLQKSASEWERVNKETDRVLDNTIRAKGDRQLKQNKFMFVKLMQMLSKATTKVLRQRLDRVLPTK